jgi:catechol-2,3-dioxygenase
VDQRLAFYRIEEDRYMRITSLDLATADITKQQAFYTETLGLPLIETTDQTFSVQVGTTRLAFQASPETKAIYHVAITVSHNTWEQARNWITRRVPLLTREGKDEFFSNHWNCNSLYFYDEAGNILEFIAHYDLPEHATGDFGVQNMLHISEIGLTVDDVPTQVKELKTLIGLEVYRDSYAEEFAAVGDTNGLFIIVKKARLWMPNMVVPAVVAPVNVTIQGSKHQQFQLAPYPYYINVV